ncbi:MAG: leucine-rich repeat domain-containing protein, partial [Trichodesmium sp. St16_bin2-tuft]|nr:leucine-rich repeat domain-containing protein [Trichodesmium sp. St16_bin2-tuft]
SISELSNLTELGLNSNQLTSLPESISKLSNLTVLNLSYNQLTSLPESISELSNLTELYLDNNPLEIPPIEIVLQGIEEIGKYFKKAQERIQEAKDKKLKELDLSSSYINKDNIKLADFFSALWDLEQLEILNLSSNQLTSLPESISKLSNLTVLNLSYNQLTSLPESIGELSNLTDLDLSCNQLKSLPESISELSNLTELGLSSNQLISLPESIGKLSNLTEVYLSFNQLKILPESISELPNLTKLYLNNNPLETPPIEIATKGIEEIRNYFRQEREKGIDYIYEAKLLIVGEGGAGKTTLANKIIDPNYQLKDEDTTKGIEVNQYKFQTENQNDFQINIWDFGGQEIYHATHQFFLTKRSLYILVADTRKEDTDFYYWLNVVELLSSNSPLLIVKNEKQEREREINQRALQGQFTNIKEILATNLATNRG